MARLEDNILLFFLFLIFVHFSLSFLLVFVVTTFIVIVECFGEHEAADGRLLLGRWEHLGPVGVAHLDEVSDSHLLVVHLLAVVVVEYELALRCVLE